MILLWGILEDSPLAAVRQVLLRLLDDSDIIFIDQRNLTEMEINLNVGTHVKCILHTRSEAIDLSSVRAAYLRPYASGGLPYPEGTNDDTRHHNATIDDIVLTWAELTSALVVNKPSKMASNNSKPYQAAMIRSLGFKIPDTLITTDPVAALEFWKQHGTVIYKSVSGIRSIVSRLTPDHLQRLENISHCPTQFQEYIHGIDYRVHIVGDKIFACEVISKSDDYRYAALKGVNVDIRSCILPPHIANLCTTLVSHMGMIVAGIDLRCTPDNDWYCFEVNPSPAFTYYQGSSNHHIDEAIAQLLVKEE